MEPILTWQQLIILLVIFLPVYYTAIALIFYRNEVRRLLAFLSKFRKEQKVEIPVRNETVTESRTDMAIHNMAFDLMEELKLVYRAAKEHNLEKVQVLDALHVRIQKYPKLKGTIFQSSISNHIEHQIQKETGLNLSNEELNQIWE